MRISRSFTILALCTTLVLTSIGCREDAVVPVQTNAQGEIEYLEPKWSMPHVESGNWLDAASGIFGNWSFQGEILTRVQKNNSPIVLTCIDPFDGSVQWEWDDWFHKETEHTDGRYFMLQGNILHWKQGDRQYWLDIDKGETVKKYQGGDVFDFYMQSLGDSYFALGQVIDSFPGLGIKSVFHGEFFDEAPTMQLMPDVDVNQTLGARAADITSAIPYIDGADTMLIIAWQQVFPNWEFQSYLGLYNLTQRQWVYDKVPLHEVDRKGVLYQPLMKYENTVITNVGKNIVCYDYQQGEMKWEREFGHDFSFSGFEISDDILVANCEDKNLYGINPRTGAILWTSEGAGTSSRLRGRILNGVVYFTGGSSGRFHAVDIHTGKTYWKLDPIRYEKSNAFWAITNVSVAPGKDDLKGRIVIQNALNMYCFEAVK